MKKYALRNGLIVTGGEVLRHKAIIVEDSIIIDIVNEDELPERIVKIDLNGNYVSPGFIDIQLNGIGGAYFGGDPTPEGLSIMEKAAMKQGTTGFLSTASTNSIELFQKMIALAVDYRPKAIGNCLGLHLEGPYINPLSRGAHPEKFIHRSTLSEVKDLLASSEGEIKVVTMAPELQPEEVIDYLDKENIVVSIGHSAATYEQAMHFLTGRKRMATHLYNAMQPMHHRNPGLIPAIFREKPFTGIVADGIHVSFPMVRMAKQMLGESLFLVTDGATSYHVGAYQHTFKGDRYVTIGADGKETLSGSALTMLKAINNAVEYVGISLTEAVNMATLYPAQALRMEDKIGQIRKGREANMAVFTSDFELKQVFYKGEEQL
jgi:N-acetylglucosamine-6-phosphate deacetylase